MWGPPDRAEPGPPAPAQEAPHPMSTDEDWERWGAQDPYYGVVTRPQFRAGVMTARGKEEFFELGRAHVEHVIGICRQHFDPHFAPRDVLDFGCGVGRLLVPFAGVAERVVGMDVSPSMRAEARRNCDERGARNVELVDSDDSLSAAPGNFDLVHSYIVLQHLEMARGRTLFAELVRKVRPGGMGALHVTFGWDLWAATLGQRPAPPPPPPPSPPPGPLRGLRSRLRQVLVPTADAPPPSPPPPAGSDPDMQMHYYNLSELHYLLLDDGITQVWTELADHGGAKGVFLFFRRAP